MPILSEQPGVRLRPLTLAKVAIFYAIVILLGWLVACILTVTGLSELYGLVVSAGLYGFLLVPIAYAFDQKLFSRAYWKISPRAFVGIAVIGFVQFLINKFGPQSGPTDPYRAFEAILVAPFVEELLRAVTICPLMARLGNTAGLVVTVLLWAWPHSLFWVALVQQSILSFIFVYSRNSLPATIGAHLAMNLIVLQHAGLARTL